MPAKTAPPPDISDNSHIEERGKEEKLSRLKRFYKDNFPGMSPHHLFPTSRGGPSSQFNLFPWPLENHRAWHKLFFNMTVEEVWERLDEIYGAIFSDAEQVVPFWLEACTLYRASAKKLEKFEEQKQTMLSQPISTTKLQNEWFRCFGSTRLYDSRITLLYMAMFLIFGGRRMTNPKNIGGKDTDSVLAKMSKMSDYRRWAVGICLANGLSNIISEVNLFGVSYP